MTPVGPVGGFEAPIPELSVVTLRDDVPLYKTLSWRRAKVRLDDCVLPAGTRGTVVHVYPGALAYEVEFDAPYPCVICCCRWEIDPAEPPPDLSGR